MGLNYFTILRLQLGGVSLKRLQTIVFSWPGRPTIFLLGFVG